MYHYSSRMECGWDGSVLFPCTNEEAKPSVDIKRQVSLSDDSVSTSGRSVPSINSNNVTIKSEVDLAAGGDFSDGYKDYYYGDAPKTRSLSFCGATQLSRYENRTIGNYSWNRGFPQSGLFACYPEDRSLRIPIPCAEERAGPTMSAGGGGLTAASVNVGSIEPTPGTPTHLGAESSACRPFIPSPDDNLEDLTPVSRDRCNTWPLPRPALDINSQTSPLIHEQIPEEDSELYDSSENVGRLGAMSTASTGMVHSPENTMNFSPGMSSPIMNGVPASGASDTSDPGCTPGSKKSTTRRNAWGNLSYADLITQAIMQSPDQRLTLSQVYEWMVQNVPYFRDKGDSNSSAGWKNSIRHNLSLHSRFMRIQNEGAGKSSWWVINPDAKPGRNPRRQRASTIDSTVKPAMERNRKGARKRVKEMGRLGGMPVSGVSSVAGSQASVLSQDIYGDEESLQASFDPFRPRAQSNLSVPGSSARVSPSMDHQTFDDFEFPSWVENTVPIPSDILDRTDQMRIDNRTMINGNVKQEVKPQQPIPPKPVENQPPSYQELNSVRGPSQLQNPLLRSHHMSSKFPQQNIPLYQPYNWIPPTQPIPNQQSCAAQQSVSVGNSLPIDLENLTLPDQPLMEMDVESLLRHELAQTRDHQIHFDI